MTPDPLTAALTAAIIAAALALTAVAKRLMGKNGKPSNPPKAALPPARSELPTADDSARFTIDPWARFADRFQNLDDAIEALGKRLDRKNETDSRMADKFEVLAISVGKLEARVDGLAGIVSSLQGTKP